MADFIPWKNPDPDHCTAPFGASFISIFQTLLKRECILESG
ncbi:hypothetical protein [Pseudooctadecabacter sp.]|nr:hypothetical protein [Pseudooctadecabacter sp.]